MVERPYLGFLEELGLGRAVVMIEAIAVLAAPGRAGAAGIGLRALPVGGREPFRERMATSGSSSEDPEERRKEFERRGQRAYASINAVNAAPGPGDIIDLAETRYWIANPLRWLPPTPERTEKKTHVVSTGHCSC